MVDDNKRPDVWIGHVRMPTPKMEESHAFMQEIGMRPIFKGETVAVLELRGVVLTSYWQTMRIMSPRMYLSTSWWKTWRRPMLNTWDVVTRSRRLNKDAFTIPFI